MIPGYTKFSPDWCFGRFNKYKRSIVGGLTDLIGVVNELTEAQPTGQENGIVVVTRQEFFKPRKSKVYRSSTTFGLTYAREAIHLEGHIVVISSKSATIHPFSIWSLQQGATKITEFCPKNFKDITCRQLLLMSRRSPSPVNSSPHPSMLQLTPPLNL